VDLRSFPTRDFDQDAPHGLGSRREKVAPAVPMLSPVYVHEAEIGFMNQGSGIEGLAGPLSREFLCGQAAKLGVDQRE
jgi:hypothetical protein